MSEQILKESFCFDGVSAGGRHFVGNGGLWRRGGDCIEEWKRERRHRLQKRKYRLVT